MLELLTTLTVAAQALVAIAIVLWLVERASSRRPLQAIGRRIGHDSLRLAWLVAAIAMAGSLYLSEVRHFTPCPLCWYQRIAMYPLVVVLGVAMVRRDHGARWYAILLALVGLAIGAYHYQLERFPDQDAIACTSSVPCTTIWFEQLGYITIPMMAMSAFALVVVILAIGGRHGQGISDEA